MRNIFNIERTFQQKTERGWTMLYLVADLHSTLILPSHDRVEFYPDAVEVVKWLNGRADFKVILWTSSFQQEIDFVQQKVKEAGIRLDFINENPLEANNHRANFERKFYFNILFEDKAGFDARFDWTLAAKAFEDATGEKILEWNQAQKDRLRHSVSEKVKQLKSVLPVESGWKS